MAFKTLKKRWKLGDEVYHIIVEKEAIDVLNSQYFEMWALRYVLNEFQMNADANGSWKFSSILVDVRTLE